MSGEDKLMSRKYSLGDPNVMRLPDDDSLHSGNVLPTGGDAARPPIRGWLDGGGGGRRRTPTPHSQCDSARRYKYAHGFFY